MHSICGLQGRSQSLACGSGSSQPTRGAIPVRCHDLWGAALRRQPAWWWTENPVLSGRRKSRCPV
eukprot:11221393-Lingulodinium_polyedra.AAC.1